MNILSAIKKKISIVYVILFTFLVILLAYIRLYFCVEFTDEAFAIATPYRFVLGNKFFIDEVSIFQFPALILYPFIKLYSFFSPTTDYLVLYSRHLFYIFTLLIAFTIFITAQNFVKRQIAILISLVGVVFVPLNIASLSYNSMGSGFFSIGCFLFILYHLQNNTDFLLFSGICHGLSVIAYPTLATTVFLTSIIFLFLVQDKKTIVLRYFGGLLIVAIPVTIVLFKNGGIKHLFNIYEYMASFGFGFDWTKITTRMYNLFNNYPNKVFSLILLITIPVVYKIKKSFSYIFLLMIPITPFYITNLLIFLQNTHNTKITLIRGFEDLFHSHGYITYLSIFAPLLVMIVGSSFKHRILFLGGWLPSIIAGFVFAFSSSNGYVSGGIGLVPAFVVTLIFLIMSLEKVYGLYRLPSINPFIQYMVLSGIILLFTFFYYNWPYRDDDLFTLKTRVNTGAYKGIYTSKEKSKYLDELTNDIKKHSNPGDKVLFYDRFPAGYILSNMIPATTTCWLQPKESFPNSNRQSIIEYYEQSGNFPDLIFRFKKVYYSKNETNKLTYPINDSLNNFIETSKFIKVESRENYDIFRRKKIF